jgi:hypothetical protein
VFTPIAVRLVLLGAAAGSCGSYGLYAMRPSTALPIAPATLTQALTDQIPNRAVKANRLAKFDAAPAIADQGAVYALASAPADTAPADTAPDEATVAPTAPALRDGDSAVAAPQAGPKIEAKPDLKPQLKVASLVGTPPETKTRRLPPPPATTGALLDDTQIAGLKNRLRLTAEQAEYWPAVEGALRDVARTQLREHRLKRVHGKPSIDVNAPEVQKLIWAAMPLLGLLREDQKHEVRKLARIIGLDQVAAQI